MHHTITWLLSVKVCTTGKAHTTQGWGGLSSKGWHHMEPKRGQKHVQGLCFRHYCWGRDAAIKWTVYKTTWALWHHNCLAFTFGWKSFSNPYASNNHFTLYTHKDLWTFWAAVWGWLYWHQHPPDHMAGCYLLLVIMRSSSSPHRLLSCTIQPAVLPLDCSAFLQKASNLMLLNCHLERHLTFWNLIFFNKV